MGLVVGCVVGWWLRTLNREVPDRRVEEELRAQLREQREQHAAALALVLAASEQALQAVRDQFKATAAEALEKLNG